MKKKTIILIVTFMTNVVFAQTDNYKNAIDNFQTNYNTEKYEDIFNSFSLEMKQALPIDKTNQFLTGLISQARSNSTIPIGLPLRLDAGISYMDVFQRDAEGEKTVQIRAPKWSGTFSANYTHTPSRLSFDLTGNWFGPQRLTIVPNDFRPEYSPWFALLNVQVSRKFKNGLELYGGIKNLLNFVPQNPILRPFDPFDRTVDDPVANPFGYTFDPSYNFAPMQGIRGFVGMRWALQ